MPTSNNEAPGEYGRWWNYHGGDVLSLINDGALEPDSFDVVFSRAVIDHVPVPKALIEACIYLSKR